MIHERKEKQDRERAQMLKTLTEKSFAGIYLVQDGRFRFVNERAASYAGYGMDELLGIKADSVVHPEDRIRIKTDARAMLRGERTSPYVFRIITKQGLVRWIMETVTPISFQGRPALLGSSMDITDRMEAEEKLRESETLYRTIFETTGTATIIVEEDTTVTLVNSEFEKLSGAPKAYWEGKRMWTEFVHEKDVRMMLDYHRRRRINPDGVPRNYEFSLLDREGNVREVLITISMIPGTKRSVASFADISERRQAEEKLRESEDRYRTIFETTGTATIIVEEDTTVTLVNSEFEKLSGAPKAYWEGKRSWTEFVHEKDVGKMLDYHRRRRIDPRSAPRNYEFGLLDREGNVREVLITISMIPGTKKSVAPYARRISSRELNLTPTEFQIADLVREGKTTKEIAEFMHVSPATIEIHRHHIRKKLGLNKKKSNIRVHLLSLR